MNEQVKKNIMEYKQKYLQKLTDAQVPEKLEKQLEEMDWTCLELIHQKKQQTLSPAKENFGGEGGIRTHGSCESLVFKTSSLNHSDTSPSSNENYFTTASKKSQYVFSKNNKKSLRIKFRRDFYKLIFKS